MSLRDMDHITVHRITPRRSAAPWIAFFFGVMFALMAAWGFWAVQRQGQEIPGGQRLSFAPAGIDLPKMPVPAPTPPAPT